MDLHILIVIACVFLASLGSLLFINKFLRRKTFEEIVAEKKAMTEKIYGKDKASFKKPKKQSLKKELKREKKQRQREQVTTTEQEDSDVHSEQASVDDEPHGLSKTHVEFEPDPEVVTYNNQTISRRSSNAEKENINKQNKGKKDKKIGAKSGILIHKNDQNIVKETAAAAEITIAQPSNHFDVKVPKDAVELKKVEKREEKSQQQNKKDKNGKKSDNRQATNVENNVQSPTEVVAAPVVIKEMKQLDEKVRQSSPKNTQKNKQQNKKQKDLKDAVVGLEKLSESDTVGVSLLMNLFRRAELNRSEIQILIDYLLNRQQDMPSTHSEWSDDICQKLKRQLEEKEKALAEEQEASIGIQAKLRELRSEINTERANMSITIKSFVEKIQTKDQDIALLEQKIKTLNDNLSLERQQFQAKLMHEKQSGSQELLTKIQMMQNDNALKEKCIADLTCMVNASRQAVEESQQKNEIIQNQAQQIRTLEQQRDELEQVSNNRIFELEKAKQLENELNDAQVEIRNLQNALESIRSDFNQKNIEFETMKNELTMVRNKGLMEKQQEISALQAKNAELTQQLLNIANQTQEQSKEHSGLQTTIETLKKQLAEKEQQFLESQTTNSQIQQQLSSVETASKKQAAEHAELQKIVETLKNDVSSKTQQLQNTEKQAETQQELQKLVNSLKADVQKKEQQLQESVKQMQKHEDLQKLIDSLKADVSNKNQKLQDVEKETEKLNNREKELIQQLQEQKEKNNDLRTKNWKLVEALQNAEAKVSKQSPNAILVQQEKLLAASSKPVLGSGLVETGKDQKHMRDLLQRLCPEAVKACAGTALSVSFNQWVEQVLTTHVKQQQQQQQISSSHKSTQSNSLQSPSAPQNSHNNANSANGSRSNSSSVSTSPGGENTVSNNSELLKENSILRIRIDELTKLARKTENTLSDLMKQAEEQDEHWRNIMHSKDEQIRALQHSNGQGDI
ncbi:kinectin isoform X1 [Lucilia cuprina]|uniref:kinectin isoform X1 n=1 Tax=Lucilia cuprina TaxID=7375 RepID=UPI001F053496|nr:kinectin isoform X1 [Lucilia cuprina]XP_046805023.1 kinectin isoform X1 [Lucilia cuprina]